MTPCKTAARWTRKTRCAPVRDLFVLPDGVTTSMATRSARCPRPADRVARAVQEEWGQGLIRSWNTAGWFDLPQRVGDKHRRLDRRRRPARSSPPTAPRSTCTRC
jgi:kynureninase